MRKQYQLLQLPKIAILHTILLAGKPTQGIKERRNSILIDSLVTGE